MLGRLATREQLTTIILLLAMVLFGIKIAQFYLPKPPSPTIVFTCAVAVHSRAGELCIKGSPGASVSVTIHYCDGTQMNSCHPSDLVARFCHDSCP